MTTINLSVGIQNPFRAYDKINWFQSKANIIYIPFPLTSIVQWYTSDPQIKQFYKIFIIPDKITIAGLPVRGVQKYISFIRENIKSVRIEKILKNSINKPVIVDLTPVSMLFWHLVNSRGIRYVAPDFFNLINSIYTMLTNSATNAQENIVILDFTNEYQELEKLLLYIKLNDYKLSTQIADRYVLIRIDGKYIPLTIDSSMEVSKQIFSKLEKIAQTKISEKEIEKLSKEESESHEITKAESKKQIKDISTEPAEHLNVEIKDEILEKALIKKFNKKIEDKNEIESIKRIAQTFLEKHPDMDVNIGDPTELANLVETALKNELQVGSKPMRFDELLAEHRKQFVFKKNIEPERIFNKKTIGVNALAATGVKWVTDPHRTKIEFDQNLDRNIYKLIESLEDPKFPFAVLGVEKTISDDGKSRFYEYKIKIKPEKGRAYITKLRVPALVHDTYLKIGGNLYAINNQLMQLPIIKKNANTVQLKTNYSVTDYSIKSFPQTIKSFEDFVTKFLNIMKTAKRLKDAEVMDAATEARLRDYGVPLDEIAKINYKKIEIKN